MRKITVIGNLGKDAKIEETKNGKKVVRFNMASTEFGEKETSWYEVSDWRENAVKLAQYLTKGKPVCVVGDYSNNIWQDKDGVSHISNRINANDVQFISVGSSQSGDTSTTSTATTTATKETKNSAPDMTTLDCGTVKDTPAIETNVDDDLPF